MFTHSSLFTSLILFCSFFCTFSFVVNAQNLNSNTGSIAVSVKDLNAVWDGYNNPYRMDANFIARFDSLPLEGEISNSALSWPGSYWPHFRGSIAWRWNAEESRDFYYKSPRISQAQSMSQAQINELSPAEKYDLLVGRDDYPTVDKMWRITSRGSPVWYGICHGVAPASIHHPEPNPITLTSVDNIDITFYTSDIKALLANFYARESQTGITQIGRRCYLTWFGRACSDVNAGAFHMILANKVGLQKVGFIADLDRGREVWNHAPVSYQSEILSLNQFKELSSPFAVSSVEVKTTVKYAASIQPHHEPIIGTPIAEYYQRDYHYYIELNTQGEIVGGTWLSWQRPDFLWFKGKEEFSGYWEKLNDLIGDER